MKHMTTKKTKRVNKTAEEVKNEMVDKVEQENDKACAEEVEVVLQKYGRALQPFLMRSEFGDQARVRLVRVPKQESTDEIEG